MTNTRTATPLVLFPSSLASQPLFPRFSILSCGKLRFFSNSWILAGDNFFWIPGTHLDGFSLATRKGWLAGTTRDDLEESPLIVMCICWWKLKSGDRLGLSISVDDKDHSKTGRSMKRRWSFPVTSVPLSRSGQSWISGEFYYGVSRVSERYLRFSLISTVDFYYIINKLIILIPDPY
jgi:hypothetical protein